MAWQTGTSSGTRDYHDLLRKFIDFKCSKNISAVVVNNVGAGYTAGDILTITHASAHLDATIEVLTIGGGGTIATYKIRNNGAFAAQVVSAVVSAAGSNYAVGNILQVEGGTWTNRAKFSVATLSGSGVATVTLFEGGGSYSSFPSNPAATTKIGPTAGTGSGCTLTLTTQAIIGTSGIAATGGTGAAATFDLTLTDTGWTAVRNRNNETVNALTDERDVILQGTSGANNDPIVGIRTFTQTSGASTRYGWLLFAMDTFNDGLATTAQVNVGPATAPGTDGVNLLMFNVAEKFWFSATPRRSIVVRKSQGGTVLAYHSAYLGFLNAFGTEAEIPYPMYLSGCSSVSNRLPDDGTTNVLTGLTEVYINDANTPHYFRHPGTGAYTQVKNNLTQVNTQNTLSPLGATRLATSGEDNVADETIHEIYSVFSTSINATTAGGSPSLLLLPTLTDNETLRFPVTVKTSLTTGDNTVDTAIRGELDGVYWISAVKSDASTMTPEDTLTAANLDRYRVFPNSFRSQPYSFFALFEG